MYYIHLKHQPTEKMDPPRVPKANDIKPFPTLWVYTSDEHLTPNPLGIVLRGKRQDTGRPIPREYQKCTSWTKY
jgi:hypothetical protein